MPAAKKTKKKTNKLMKPPIEDGSFSVVMSGDEMFSLIQILSFSRDVFEKMAETCMKEGDQKGTQAYGARSDLSMALYRKFQAVAGIGEPTSREVH